MKGSGNLLIFGRVRALGMTLKQQLLHLVTRPRFIALPETRSASDSGYYPEAVRRAAHSTRAFARFRRNPVYREVLEHVGEQQGHQYLEQILLKWPTVLDDPSKFTLNDRVGKP